MNVADPEIFAQAQAEVMGEWHSAPMVAYGTLKRLSSWKMYCRAKNVPFEIANAISDNLGAYEMACKHSEDPDDIFVQDYIPGQYIDLFRESEQYMGVVDSISPQRQGPYIGNNI